MQEIQEFSFKKKPWDEYFKKLGEGEDYIKDLIKNTDDLSKLEGQDLVNACNDAREAVIAHNKQLENMSFKAKASQAALKGLAIAGNILSGILISAGASLAIKAIDNYIHKIENINESIEETRGEYESTKSELESINSELEETKQKIENLSVNGKWSAAITNALLVYWKQIGWNKDGKNKGKTAGIKTIKALSNYKKK